ncbi:MAG: (d)CMP kinase [Pseudomonadota bacterium]
MSADPPVITVDGPSGAGKGTLCYQLAKRLQWHLLDSGALYRVTALAALEAGIDLSVADAGAKVPGEPGAAINDGSANAVSEAIAAIARNLAVSFVPSANGVTRVMLSNSDVSTRIRLDDCSELASKVAAMKAVRVALLERQKQMAKAPGLVADGRDMGTVVFPNAPLKFFLTASSQARAERRRDQLLAQGQSVTLARLLEAIEERDARDKSRVESPLVPAADAIVVDSTELSAEQVLVRALQEAEVRNLLTS